MKRTAIILLCAALGLASGCGSQDNGDAEQALENVAEETTAEETFPGPVSAGLESLEGFDEDAWALYEKGVAAMNALTSREEQFIVNTVQEENGTSTEESVNVRLKRTGLGSDSPKFSASGHVETGGQDIPLDMYYRDGMLYSISGNAKVKKQADYETSVATVDILGEFLSQLKREYIVSINKEEYADGTVFIGLAFNGPINEVETSGSGELILNAEGCIISEQFTLTVESEQDGSKSFIRQEVECMLINYGDTVSDIEFPDPNDFVEV